MTDYADLVQWPPMLVTVAASWFVASNGKGRRNLGFWLFLLSNVAWVVWGVSQRAYALVILQFCLAAINIRGARKPNRRRRLTRSELQLRYRLSRLYSLSRRIASRGWPSRSCSNAAL